ncbi:MAG: oxidoreductase [Bacteroidales bacterium]
MNQKKINVGIIGYGLSGKVFHAPFLDANPGFNLKSIVERNHDFSKKDYPYIGIVSDYHELLSDDGLDLIVVATPNTLHFPMAKAALLAGKHVVVEKPFTPTTQEADELIELANFKDRKLFVYHNRRWDGDFLTVKKIKKYNMLGDFEYFESRFDRFRPELVPGVWRDEDLPGGGVLYDLGPHLIDQALQLFGRPQGVTAIIENQREGSKVDDYFKLILSYEKCEVVLTAGMLVEDSTPHYIIHGSNGSFVKYGLDPQEGALKRGEKPDKEGWGRDAEDNYGFITLEYEDEQTEGRIITEAGCYQEFYNNVFDVLINGAEMAVKPEEAREVIGIIERAFSSNEKRLSSGLDIK